MADGNSTVNESNESNNTRCTAQTIQVTLPDLVLASMQASPATVRRGARFDIVNQVSNTGAVPSQASTVEFRLSVNTVFGDADDIVLNSGSRSVNTLAAGSVQQRDDAAARAVADADRQLLRLRHGRRQPAGARDQ